MLHGGDHVGVIGCIKEFRYMRHTFKWNGWLIVRGALSWGAVIECHSTVNIRSTQFYVGILKNKVWYMLAHFHCVGQQQLIIFILVS